MARHFSHTASNELKKEALKQRLIECVQKEKDKFITAAELFNNLERRDEGDYLALCDAIITAVDNVLTAGDWNDSLFLRNTVKPLKQIRDHAVELRQTFEGVEADNHMVAPEAGENCIKLYVSLYQTNGHDMKKWASQLSALGNHMIGRPIYRNESDVIKAIRARSAQISEAYVVVAVDKTKIIANEYTKPLQDRLGNELVTLIPGAVDAHNIIEFVHQSARYYFCDQQLFPLAKRANGD